MSNFFWTPHSGYHWDGSSRRFFEGWYLRLTLPAENESFSFMYSIDDPDGRSDLSGGAAQILGPGEQYLYAALPSVSGFWAWPHRLGLGHWEQLASGDATARCLLPDDFWTVVRRGYQLTATQHQGWVEDADTGAIARWNFQIEPVYGWGPPDGPQLPTAGWLSYLPVAEPGWQVLMAHGLATGWAEWGDRRFEFQQAPTYAEKNWGGAFPEQWFWMQANAFRQRPDLSVVAVGSLRQILGHTETVGLMGLHFQGRFIALSSLHHRIAWQVSPWGCWRLEAWNHRYRVLLQGRAESDPSLVRIPTLAGLQFGCCDTTHGELDVQVWERSLTPPYTESLILHDSTSLAALEIGRQGWEQGWQFSN